MFREGPGQVQMVKMDAKSSVKISKDGTEVDNSGNNIENVKANVKVRSGKWYYECKLLTYGKMHIGWCTDKCKIETNAYSGVGNDAESWSYDGSCQRAWHGSTTSNDRYGEYWNNGDVIGTVLDLENKTISFYRNGKDMGVAFHNVVVGDGISPAASLQKKQKCSFNFGKDAFKYQITEVFPDIHPLHLSLSDSQQKELEKMYEKYKDPDNDTISGDGLMEYTKELGITEDKDPGFFIIAWKLSVNHEKCWDLHKDEFVGGWAIHGCHNIATMKKKLQIWKDEIKNPSKFRSFYNFVFDYLKEDKKILAIEEATTVWDMLGMHQRWPMMGFWVSFLQDKKSVSRDTWRLFLNFTEQYPTNLDSYDSEGCWPSMIDEFVEYVKAKKESK